MLTAAEVEQKTFSTALRGYDLDEVDDFLDEIVATIRDLTDQLEEAKKTRADASAVVTAVPEPETEPVVAPEPEPELEPEPIPAPPSPPIDESAIGRALVAAQHAADQLLEEARDEAGKIVDGAKTEADSWTAEREEKKREAEEELAALAERVASVRSELTVLATEVADKLDDMDAVIAGPGDTDTGSVSEDDEGVDGAEPSVGEETARHWGDDDSSDEAEMTIDEANNGTDHLDDILTGVATDLQLVSDDSDDDSDGDDDEGDEDDNFEETDEDE
jgi:DivIVA domain-containing protein